MERSLRRTMPCKKRQVGSKPHMYISPAFVLIFLLGIVPTIFIVIMSFHSWDLGTPWSSAEFIGLGNYRYFFSGVDSDFQASIKTTLLFVVGTVLAELVLGFLIALLLNWKELKGRGFLTGCLTIPMVLMPTMVGMVWRLYYSYHGMINYFLETLFGFTVNWFSMDNALLAVMITEIWQWTPFFILVFLAGLQSLPSEPYEAARVDGASRLQAFVHITLPLLKPLIIVATLLRTMDAFRLFDLTFAMTKGGPGNVTEIIPIYIYRINILRRSLGQGATISVFLTGFILALCLLFMIILEHHARDLGTT